jgi:predicted MFS family arabinose efflux permease
MFDARLQARTSLLASSLAEANRELAQLALHDTLTRLPNRVLLEDLADKQGAVPALKIIFSALVILLLVFQFTASIQYAALATVLVMGIFAFGNVPGLQVYVVQKAEQYTPNAVDVASGLNIAAFNIGIALGSIIGGQTVQHAGLEQTPWMGSIIVLGALLLVVISGRLDKSACATLRNTSERQSNY